MKIRWTENRRKLYYDLKANVPEGHDVFTSKQDGKLYIFVTSFESDYYAPWHGLKSILTNHGF